MLRLPKLLTLMVALSIISLFSNCTKPAISCFDYSPTTPNTGTIITFNAACSENAFSYSWTFGDKTKDTTTSELTISHKYTTAGYYSVTLNAKRKDGISFKSSKAYTKIITVQ